MSDSESAPSASFWKPLSLGKVLLIFLVVQIVVQLVCAVLREGLGVPIPPTAAAGGAGVLAVLLVSRMATKAKQG